MTVAMDTYFGPLLQLAAAITDTSAYRPHPTQLRQTIDAILRDAASACAAAQVPEADYRDALYAMVACFDELLQSQYAPHEWSPAALTLAHFEDNNAGVGFFTRLDHVQDEQRWHVLRVYYLALGLGFSGKYGLSGDRNALTSHRRALARVLGLSTALPPLGATPAPRFPKGPAWFAWAPFGLVIAALVGLVLVVALR